MGLTKNTATLLPGRNYTVTTGGITDLTRRYQVLRDPRQTIETLEVALITGLPAIGDAHPANAYAVVNQYRITEDDNGQRWVIEVMYSSMEFTRDYLNRPPKGQAETSRGWEAQDVSVDLTHDALTGEALLNSAGDPFESVPQVARSLPVFRLVRRESTAVSSRLALSGTVNAAAISIDGVSIPRHGGRLTVSSRKLYLDADGFEQEFTYTVTIMANIVDGNDIGWDIAFVQAGLFHLKSGETAKQRAMEQDAETKEWRPRATPVLLDANGYKLEGKDAVNKIVNTMPEASWGSIF
jgi:hypothetical protein